MHSQRMASITPIVIECIDYLAYGTFFTRAMFCPKKKLDVFFSPEKPQMNARRWWYRVAPYLRHNNYLHGNRLSYINILMRVLFYKRVCHTHMCVNTVRTLSSNTPLKPKMGFISLTLGFHLVLYLTPIWKPSSSLSRISSSLGNRQICSYKLHFVLRK
jgi:hypothetical protein